MPVRVTRSFTSSKVSRTAASWTPSLRGPRSRRERPSDPTAGSIPRRKSTMAAVHDADRAGRRPSGRGRRRSRRPSRRAARARRSSRTALLRDPSSALADRTGRRDSGTRCRPYMPRIIQKGPHGGKLAVATMRRVSPRRRSRASGAWPRSRPSFPALVKAGSTVLVEAGAGPAAGFPDEAYAEKGAAIVASRDDDVRARPMWSSRCAPGARARRRRAGPGLVPPGSGRDRLSRPAWRPRGRCRRAGRRGVTAFALELMPRITRAQSMDVLSSLATIAGYKAVLLAADAPAADVPDADDGGRHDRARRGCSWSARAWRGCRRSRRRGGSAPWSRPTTCGPR